MTATTIDRFFFRGDIQEKMSASHQVYANELMQGLKERKEMILDFDALQSSIDPALDSKALTDGEDNQEEKFDYECFLTSYFCTIDAFKSLEIFKLKGYARAGPKFPLMEGMRGLYGLTELDLSQNNLQTGDLQEQLQLWSLVELRTLRLDSTSLTKVPPSIGRLRKLETLSLSSNNLETLPLTLGHCSNLKYLDLTKNKFKTLPGVILKLEKLEDLKRLKNNLEQRSDGYRSWPHIRRITRTQKASRNPDSLQALTSCTVMTSQTDYWAEKTLPPRQCQLLDSYATEYQFCHNCHQANSLNMIEVRVLLLKFAELTNVPISVFSCQDCESIITDHFSDLQTKLQNEIDSDYEREMAEAMKEFLKDQPNGEYRPPPIRRQRHTNGRRRHQRRKCSIM